MRYLVTGGAGFIGSHLCNRLLAKNHSVVCIDDLSTGRLANLKQCLKHPKFLFVEQDIRKSFDYEVDGIFHLGCAASPVHYQAEPIKTLETNFLGTQNALELATRLGIKVLFTSTSEVYGDPHIHPQTETYLGNVNCFGPRACYDEGKRVAETLCYEYHHRKGTQIRVARIFNTYGPHMAINDGRIISNFIIQALKNVPITIYGNGEQTRSFCYVDDNLNGLHALFHSEIQNPVNIGAPFEFTVNKLAKMVKKLTHSSSELIYHPLPGDDPKQRRPDISNAEQHLQWSPQVSLQEGLQLTIEYFKHALAEKSPA